MHGPGQSGVALAGRLPLRNVSRVILPNPDLSSAEMTSFDKGLITAEVVDEGHCVAVGSLHMVPFHRFGREAGEAEFSHIWDQAAKEIVRSMRKFTFVGGDFNTLRRDLLDTPLMPAHATGVDTILYGEQAKLVSVETIDTFSDHPLCVVEFVLS
jgi:endonuclease/exonuclease/phosphatase family metal-dependent hydrolase